MHSQADILTQISTAVLVAAVLAFVAKYLRQPLILAYVAAGAVVGSVQGFGWVDTHQIEPVSELGLILLLFMIGLEIDLKKLRESGNSLVTVGLLQFPLCVLLGLPVARALGFGWGPATYDALYVAIAAALSSTMIVVKLLYDKYELDTVPGRITLGVLVFQDIWAILFLAIQHDLKDPGVTVIALSLVKGVALVALAFLLSRYVLPPIFRSVAKMPELVLIGSLAWCFGISMLAAYWGLSREMGALIAGVAFSAFPYNLDVVAKIISLRDFFIVLFFVSLGTRIPQPSVDLVVTALLLSGFLVVSRLLSIFPVLHFFRMGHRSSLIPAINLAQISEFSLVICAIGVSLGHVSDRVLSVVVYTLVFTSVVSTYGIVYNFNVYRALAPALRMLGFRDLEEKAREEAAARAGRQDVFFLGFSRVSSSLFQDLVTADPDLAQRITVVDFNPVVKRQLDERGIHYIYGDISHLGTLHHAEVEHAKVILSTIPDHLLKGTTNAKLLTAMRSAAPHAEIIVTADSFQQALELYRDGASYVFIPRLMSIKELEYAVYAALDGTLEPMRQHAAAEVEMRASAEVLP